MKPSALLDIEILQPASSSNTTLLTVHLPNASHIVVAVRYLSETDATLRCFEPVHRLRTKWIFGECIASATLEVSSFRSVRLLMAVRH